MQVAEYIILSQDQQWSVGNIIRCGQTAGRLQCFIGLQLWASIHTCIHVFSCILALLCVGQAGLEAFM